MRETLKSLRGHLWTVGPSLHVQLRGQPRTARGSAFVEALEDPQVGTVRVTGEYHHTAGARDLLVAIHGLGGSIDSPYMARPATVASTHGLSCLRLNLRGADRSGDDVYHGALTADLSAALASPRLAAYRNIYVLGFSMGGHMALSWALAPSDGRVRAVCSVCSPLALALSSAWIDRPRRVVYRHHVLGGLKEIHAATEARGRAQVAASVSAKITNLRNWDELIVAPRFGFESAQHYWETISVGPQLEHLQLPCLLLSTRDDPMVPPAIVEPSLVGLHGPSEARWLAGGHLGFPAGVYVEEPALAWMQRFAGG